MQVLFLRIMFIFDFSQDFGFTKGNILRERF